MINQKSDRGVFSQDFLERVVEATNIIAIYSKYTTLKKSGKNYMGLCPFHREKTPSFSVDPDRGLFYCFGCGKGGNIFTFLMEKEGFSFYEAVEYLAKQAGIPVPKRRGALSRNEAQNRAVEIAYEFFRKQLFSPSGGKARDYLSKRGIKSQLIREVGIGFAPDGWDNLLKYITTRRLDTKPFEEVGLLVRNPETGSVYDRFRNGIIFPIRSVSGRVVGFAMRTLDEDPEKPKYINSPDSALYHKGKILFGLDRAKKAIRQKGFAVIVEGYFDVLSLWQAGIENVVAGCGTAFTNDHAQALLRFTDEAVLFFDGDDAGLAATYRALIPLLSSGFIAKIARPPEGLDPDDVARKFPKQKVEEIVGKATDWLEFSVEIARKTEAIETVEGKIRLVDRLAKYINAIGDEMTKALYTKRLAEKFELSESSVAKRIAKSKETKTFAEIDTASKTPVVSDKYAKIELELISMMIANPLVGEIVDEELFELYRGAVKVLKSQIDRQGSCSAEALTDVLEEKAMSYITKTLLSRKIAPTQKEAEIILNQLRKRRLEKEKEKLYLLMREAQKEGDTSRAAEISNKIAIIQRKILELR